MRRFFLICTCVAFELQLLCGFLLHGYKSLPRLRIHEPVMVGHTYQTKQPHTILFFHNNSAEVIVGGTDFIIRLSTKDYTVKEIFYLNATEQKPCPERHTCKNVINVIESFDGGLFVCGRNDSRPTCWKLDLSSNNETSRIVRSYSGKAISPASYNIKTLSVVADGDLYAAVPLNADKSTFQFRRRAGNRREVWMSKNWMKEPTFISASWVKRLQDPENEMIYIFFQEKNPSTSPDADPFVSEVARVCKVDEGGSKAVLQNMWTSFLKTRLVCGFPDKALYFNHLQDVYVVHDDNWANTRVYALFSSNWNYSAVCVYTVGMIEHIFQSSTFKGYSKSIPTPRPGMCHPNSRSLPEETLRVVKDYPQMTDWVRPVNSIAPFYISRINYTRMVVDQVQAADQLMYNVLLLATDHGKIYKILDTGSEPFIISEMQLQSSSTIQTMKLDTQKKQLVVGFSEKLFILDLESCQNYNRSCADCVLAQDPYCAWTRSGCSPAVLGGIQNVKNGQTTQCFSSVEEKAEVNRFKRETHILSPKSVTVHTVPLNVSLYLSCPIESYHAVYTWEHDKQESTCEQMQSFCLNLIPAVAREHYGTYNCISEEKDYKKLVKQYQLVAPVVIETKTRKVVEDSSHTCVSLTLLTVLGLTVALLQLTT
ncbi:semaphorin-7A isoform X3 [Cynoglossus semilaevis]|uniref:semaphorin-7A isoform X3 n=1 Tax=Cynoglossus semilaevis TaxID=244447 RepID=UPI000497A34B|nr:semaphorin-7A isoform X3 [Cynoglossus semilaevis]